MTADDAAGSRRFEPGNLRRFATDVLESVGVPSARAATAAETLVLADLRGVNSHGLARLAYYVSHIERGTIDPAAALSLVRETASTLVYDAHDGLGIALAPEAMDGCIARAEASGVAFCTVRHSSHFGIGAAYVLPPARRGLGALAMTNAGPLVVPAGGGTAMLGTNPIAFAVPVGLLEPPLVLDMATSAVAWGKIENARRTGRADSHRVGARRDGRYDDRPLSPPAGLRHSGAVTASATRDTGWRPWSTCCAVPLAGALWGTHLASVQRPGHRPNLGHCFFVWRIDAFRDPEEFGSDLRQLLTELRATPPIEGVEAVLAPGDPEIVAEARHRHDGIVLDPGWSRTWTTLPLALAFHHSALPSRAIGAECVGRG
jgi:LDH2 family malate/lactate/ureidoglycolate dehydrogenase